VGVGSGRGVRGRGVRGRGLCAYDKRPDQPLQATQPTDSTATHTHTHTCVKLSQQSVRRDVKHGFNGESEAEHHLDARCDGGGGATMATMPMPPAMPPAMPTASPAASILPQLLEGGHDAVRRLPHVVVDSNVLLRERARCRWGRGVSGRIGAGAAKGRLHHQSTGQRGHNRQGGAHTPSTQCCPRPQLGTSAHE
jgi:hypothetical protein